MTPVSIVLHFILRHIELTLRLHAAIPSLELPDASAQIAAAEAAASGVVTAELLLGVAFVESRFDVTAVSRVEGGARRTGRYPSLTPPPQLDAHASLYCGPLQTYAASWQACLSMRDLKTAYAAGAAELGTWLRDRRVQGDVVRALAGHGCGNQGVPSGTCNGYPERVLWMERRFRLGVDHRGAVSRNILARS